MSVAFTGKTVAVSVVFLPNSNIRTLWLSVTPVTGTFAALTVTVQSADLSPAVAVMVAVPTPTADTAPLLTVATLGLLLLQLSDVPAGDTFAEIVALFPSVSESEV